MYSHCASLDKKPSPTIDVSDDWDDHRPEEWKILLGEEKSNWRTVNKQGNFSNHRPVELLKRLLTRGLESFVREVKGNDWRSVNEFV